MCPRSDFIVFKNSHFSWSSSDHSFNLGCTRTNLRESRAIGILDALHWHSIRYDLRQGYD